MSSRGRANVVVVTSALLTTLAVRSTPARADDEPAALPSPPLTVTVTPGEGRAPWKLRVTNTGEVPVRIVADPRLLSFEVTPAAAPSGEATAKPVRCALPDDARPSHDEARNLVVPGGRSWSASVDPLFYCFGAREREALTAGATLTAHFGWREPPVRPGKRARAKPAPPAPPFVAAPVGAAVGRVAPAKDLDGMPVTLTASVAATVSPSSTESPSSAAGPATPSSASPTPAALPPSPLSISMPEALDVARGYEIQVTVTVANAASRPIELLFRPETLGFVVVGPSAPTTCGSRRMVDSPIRELYTRLGPDARTSTSVLLTALCPSGTFDEPGVYRVTPSLDTTGASARSIGLETWDGTATGARAMLLRVRSPRRSPWSAPTPVLD